MIPLIISTVGRVVATSTKPDIVRATAIARAQYGMRLPLSDTPRTPPHSAQRRPFGADNPVQLPAALSAYP